MKTISSALTTRPRYCQAAAMTSVWQSRRWNASTNPGDRLLFLWGWSHAHLPPHRRGLRIRVAGYQQHLCLMRLQHSRGLLPPRPPHKSSLREPLLRQPKSLPVEDQDTDRRAAPAAKENQASRERIRLQFLLTQSTEAINPLPSVDRFHRHQDSHLGCDLDHDLSDHTIRLKPTNSATPMPFIWIRILLPAPSNSTTHSAMPATVGAISSINLGNSPLFCTGLIVCSSFFKRVYSTRKVRDVR